MKDKSIVIIKPKAYYNMLVHVLRFGNKARDKNRLKEVMGVLIGRLEGEGTPKNVIVEDAIPISHGSSIEVSFSPEDYSVFEAIDMKYAKFHTKLFSCGWYHSHPELTIFFSGTDIKNQLGWQSGNPSAIGIVFDHSYLEKPGDVGFRTFRLDDPSKGINSKYHEVKTIIEVPDSHEYYLKLIELMNSIHEKQPPILELKEVPDFIGEIFIPSQEQLKSRRPSINYEEFSGHLRKGLNEFMDGFIKPFVEYLNEWSQELLKRVIKTNFMMRENLEEIVGVIREGLNSIQKTIKNSIKEGLDGIDSIWVEEEILLEGYKPNLLEYLNTLKNETKSKIDTIFKTALYEPFEGLVENFKNNCNNIEKISRELEEQVNLENIEKNYVQPLKEKFFTFKSNLEENIKVNETHFQEGMKTNWEEMEQLASKLRGELENYNSVLKDIMAQIEGIKERNEGIICKHEEELGELREAINILTTEKNRLEDELKQSKEKIKQLTLELNKKQEGGGEKE
ncbi:MAG: hypothetical protein ACTSWE_00425 [Promethearchaeota archaeon]